MEERKLNRIHECTVYYVYRCLLHLTVVSVNPTKRGHGPSTRTPNENQVCGRYF